MKKVLRVIAAIIGVAFLGAQFVRPPRTNPAYEPSQSAFNLLEMPPAVVATLRRACIDCHTNDTRWLWYNQVAPVSWWTIDHVNHGRSHLNFSEWGKLPPKDAAELVEDICKEIEAGAMPLPSYLWMHRDARLTAEDRKVICLWTVEQSNKLRGKTEAHEGHRE